MPSARLLRAAHAEREELARHRRRLLDERESLRAELERLEDYLAEVTERETLLERLAGPVSESSQELIQQSSRSALDGDEATGVVLRGPEIRQRAVRLMIAHPDRPEALHYREWYALLLEAGYVVRGKDPLATFLTQLSRSPVIRKGTQSGVYELDGTAPRRLRQRLDELHDELRSLATSVASSDAAVARARRTEITVELTRVEKAYEEADQLLGTEVSPP